MISSPIQTFVHLALAIAAGIAQATSSAALAAEVDLYILAGQSNMVGMGAAVDQLPAELRQPQHDVFFSYWTSAGRHAEWTALQQQPSAFGPEITLGRRLANDAAANGRRIALLKVAFGGTAIDATAENRPCWHPQSRGQLFVGDAVRNLGPHITPPTPHHFERLLNCVSEASHSLETQGHYVRISGIVWMQGESDSLTVAAATSYGDNLQALIAALRQAWGADLPFVFGRIRHRATAGTNGGAPVNFHVTPVRKGMQRVALEVPKTSLVSIDDFATSDGVHFASHQAQLGDRFYTALRRARSIQARYDVLAASDFDLGEWHASQAAQLAVDQSNAICGQCLRVDVAPSRGETSQVIWQSALAPRALNGIDTLNISVAAAFTGTPAPVFQFLIEQQGERFVHRARRFQPRAPFDQTEREGFGASELTSVDFFAIKDQGAKHPDFSPQGGELRFGLEVISDEPASMLIDDFTVDFYHNGHSP